MSKNSVYLLNRLNIAFFENFIIAKKNVKNSYLLTMIDSLQDEFNKNPQMWTFLITGLLALFYAALKIKEYEPNDYLKKIGIVAFQGFELRIPSWWTKTISGSFNPF